MDPQLLRMFMHVASIMMAVLVASFLPFSAIVNVVIAALVWLLDSIVTEITYRQIVARRGNGGR